MIRITISYNDYCYILNDKLNFLHRWNDRNKIIARIDFCFFKHYRNSSISENYCNYRYVKYFIFLYYYLFRISGRMDFFKAKILQSFANICNLIIYPNKLRKYFSVLSESFGKHKEKSRYLKKRNVNFFVKLKKNDNQTYLYIFHGKNR